MNALTELPETTEPLAALTEADAHGCRWIDGEATPLRRGLGRLVP
jgi:hypothetical protein